MTHLIDRGDGIRLACQYRAGRGPTILFLPGYASDMQGSKALALDAFAARSGHAMLRFDYSGCGASEGDFGDGSISRWCADALAAIDALALGPLLLVGSSMGGWIALLLARALGPRVVALVGVAAAPDFTEWGMGLTDDERRTLSSTGRIERANPYGPEPTIYTHTLLDDAPRHVLLGKPIDIDVPVRLLQGQQDDDVPWELAPMLVDALRSSDVQLVLIKDGDHRLSRPADLALLQHTVEDLLEMPR